MANPYSQKILQHSKEEIAPVEETTREPFLKDCPSLKVKSNVAKSEQNLYFIMNTNIKIDDSPGHINRGEETASRRETCFWHCSHHLSLNVINQPNQLNSADLDG